jgi:DNA-binding beta-propeller fold protein YncE
MSFILRLLVLVLSAGAIARAGTGLFLSPAAIVAMDTQFFIACETGCRVLCLDVAGRPISNISMPLPASGLALSPDHSTLFVTCAGPESKVCVVDTRRLKIIRTFPAGHKAGAPVLSPDGRTLYVCDQFDDDVTVIDLTGSSGRGPHAVVGHDVRSASPGAPSIARPARQEVGDFASSGGQESSFVGQDVRSASGVDDGTLNARLLTSSPTNVSSGRAMLGAPGAASASDGVVGQDIRSASGVDEASPSPRLLTSLPTKRTLDTDDSLRRRLQDECRIPVRREPVAADITRDGRFLLVANELPAGRADVENVAAVVSVIDTAARQVVQEIELPNGSGSVKDLRVSPDGRHAAVTHIVSSFSRATSKVQFGWMNANALTIINLAEMKVAFSVLLDEPTRGASNPWGVAWSEGGKILAVAHSGTDEVSLIDFPTLLHEGLASPRDRGKGGTRVLTYISHYEGMDPGLPFLTGARVRVKLPAGDLGPRSLVFVGSTLYVANYFSDTVSVIETSVGHDVRRAAGVDGGAGPRLLTSSPTSGTLGLRLLMSSPTSIESIPLGKRTQMDAVRLGDYYFHDGKLCLQGWQSCASCHPDDARVDGFNWDLLNDGIGNPKSTRSLLLSFETPPAMFLGVRTNAAVAVRAGLKAILFTNAPESVAEAIDAYLKSLKPVPSPHLVHGRLSASARRGAKVFQSVGCADCHVPGRFTDLKPHDVGTRRSFDRPGDLFYTPTLVEVWRTAPYLHDGSAATMREVLTRRNPANEHGVTKDLSEQELNDLCEYVLSL